MTDSEIIIALGNTTAVARELGVSEQQVSNWKTRGISWRYRPSISKMAKKRHVPLPVDFLAPKPQPLLSRDAARTLRESGLMATADEWPMPDHRTVAEVRKDQKK